MRGAGEQVPRGERGYRPPSSPRLRPPRAGVRANPSSEAAQSEEGSGGTLALVIVLAAITVAAAVIAAGVIVAAEARAAVTADSAALAAATAVAGYSDVDPCVAAAEVVAANGARLTVCEVHGTAVTVGCETKAGVIWVPAISRAGQPEAYRVVWPPE